VWVCKTHSRGRFNGSFNRIGALFAVITFSCSDGKLRMGERFKQRRRAARWFVSPARNVIALPSTLKIEPRSADVHRDR
jgi:hypothetical protein